MSGVGAAAAGHVEHFNEAVRGGHWPEFAERFAPDARMVFTNVPAGPFVGRAAILAGYVEQPPTDTMAIVDVVEVAPDTARVAFRWDAGGPGTMVIRWAGGLVTDLQITFG